MQDVAYKSKEKNWSPLLLLYRRRFIIRFRFLFELFFNLFVNVGSATTTLDRFQFQRQVRLSQINVVVSIRLRNFGGFSKHQSKTSGTDRHKG